MHRQNFGDNKVDTYQKLHTSMKTADCGDLKRSSLFLRLDPSVELGAINLDDVADNVGSKD